MGASESNWIIHLDGRELPDRALIGGKAWSIARMTALGLPVPPAFVITTKACLDFLQRGEMPNGLEAEVREAVARLEEKTGRRFGGEEKPLLVSVRSGAAISMPGMMDTVLNLGVDEMAEKALAEESRDPVFARNTHRRFFDLYASIVMKVGGVELSEEDGPTRWSAQIKEAAGAEMPDCIDARLMGAISAVFDSWNARRARRYRDHHGISHDLGTAVTVQAMVFGNLDRNSGTGVLFSRNPLTGENKPYGEYLECAQGEDVVSGSQTPKSVELMARSAPEAYDALMEAAEVLERQNREMQDIEFTVQEGELYLLQSRTGKRAPAAAVRIAVEMAEEGLIEKATAVARVSPDQARILLAPHLPEGVPDEARALATGEGACPGVGVGVVVTDSDEAERRAAMGEGVILARPTTSPEDVHGMIASTAVVTEMGGSTSHAAVVSRALGLPCVVGCGGSALAGLEGKTVTVDGAVGKVYEGALEVVEPAEEENALARKLTSWAEELSPITVFHPDDAPADGFVDLSVVKGGEDPENLEGLLAGGKGAGGGAIASDAGVRAAVSQGLEFIIGAPRLPLLLAAVRAANEPGPAS